MQHHNSLDAQTVVGLEAEVDRLKEALRPFADCIFNNNHDITVDTSRIHSQHYIDAYWAMRKEMI